jgi:hypothetical protein
MAQNNVFSDQANTVGNLNGLFKTVYGDKLKNLIPDGVKLLNRIKFDEKHSTGDMFSQPVILGSEHGVTFATSTDDAFALNTPIASSIKNATVRGSPIVMRSVLGYKAAAAAAKGGEKAFMDATKYLVSNMLRSVTKKLEICMLYGGVGLGKVASVASLVVSITESEWASGIWAGAEGMMIEIRSSGGTLRGSATITAVDVDAKTITVDAVPVGTVATDVIWHGGSSTSAYGKEMLGIHYILTRSGTLFGIDNSLYSLFKANSYDAASGPLTFAKLSLAAAKAIAKGMDSGTLLAVINPQAWSNLLTEQAALRRYDSSYSDKEVKQGARGIVFASQNGDIEIVPSIYCKEGYAYLLSEDSWSRIGSQDVSFNTPGRGEEMFRQLDGSAGFELRVFTDQAVFCNAPGHNVLITGIVNDDDGDGDAN